MINFTLKNFFNYNMYNNRDLFIYLNKTKILGSNSEKSEWLNYFNNPDVE